MPSFGEIVTMWNNEPIPSRAPPHALSEKWAKGTEKAGSGQGFNTQHIEIVKMSTMSTQSTSKNSICTTNQENYKKGQCCLCLHWQRIVGSCYWTGFCLLSSKRTSHHKFCAKFMGVSAEVNT